SFEVRYSTDNGATFPITNLIFSTTNPSVTSVDWTVPNTPTAEARIRVEAATNSGSAIDIISGQFTITGDGGAPQGPLITSASVSGKKLFVNGQNFQMGAIVEINGADQGTTNLDDFSHQLRCKKGGKKIAPGAMVTLNVRNPDNNTSPDF